MLTQTIRSQLLHEGGGNGALSGYVEIEFDNSDGRFPVAQEYVRLRRTIGTQKDDYQLNGSARPRTEIMELLESAGFSQSNPYYIVPQGRIARLTNASDAERLNILKEIAGLETYENRRLRTKQILDKTEHQLQDVRESLSIMRTRIDDLKQETKDLEVYRAKDAQKRDLEYTIRDRQLKTVVKYAEKAEQEKGQFMAEFEEFKQQYDGLQAEISELDDHCRIAERKLELYEEQRAASSADLTRNEKQKADLSLQLARVQSYAKMGGQSHAKLAERADEIEQLITKNRQLIDELQPVFNELGQKETKLRDESVSLGQRLAQLQFKESQMTRFESRDDRDKFLQNEISQLQRLSKSIQSNIQDIAKEGRTIDDKNGKLKQHLDDALQSLAELKEQDQLQNQLYSDAVAKERDLKNELSQLWRQEKNEQGELKWAKEQLDKQQRILQESMGRELALGIQSIQKIIDGSQIQGTVHGPLYELIEIADQFTLAAEVTAGVSLFHIVVDSDQTAAELLEKKKAAGLPGKITIMPLNRLTPPSPSYPQDTNSVIPLIQCIQYDATFEPAVKQVFGKMLVCEKLQVATEFSRSTPFNTVTLGGDRVNTSGVMTGGYLDSRKTRWNVIQQVRKFKEEFDQLEQALIKTRQDVLRKQQEITANSNELETLRQKLSAIRAQRADLTDLTVKLRYDEEATTKSKQTQQKQLQEYEAEFGQIENQINSYKDEMDSEFRNNLTDGEQEELVSVSAQLAECKARLNEAVKGRGQVEEKLQAVQMELDGHLYRTRDDIAKELQSIDQFEGPAVDEVSLRAELSSIDQSINDNYNEIAKLKSNTAEVQKSLSQLQSKRSELRDSLEELSGQLTAHDTRMSEATAKLTEYVNRRSQLTKELSSLGLIDVERLNAQYGQMDANKLLAKMLKIDEEIKRIGKVNRSAFNQLESCIASESEITRKLQELESSQISIHGFIETLDQEKYEVAMRTFESVRENFSKVFKRLVPNGIGELELRWRESESGEEQNVDQCEGIGIKVSFNSEDDEQQHIEQLSGGQKTLCALTLLFAIQLCDPAPFYLFDEIDAALDKPYRTAVSQMLYELSHQQEKPCQFICTTFHGEMLEVADKFYGVRFDNKTSQVQEIDQQQALEFVNDNAN